MSTAPVKLPNPKAKYFLWDFVMRSQVHTVVQFVPKAEDKHATAGFYFPEVIGDSMTVPPGGNDVTAPSLQVKLHYAEVDADADCIKSTISVQYFAKDKPVGLIKVCTHLLFKHLPDKSTNDADKEYIDNVNMVPDGSPRPLLLVGFFEGCTSLGRVWQAHVFTPPSTFIHPDERL